MPFCCPDGPFAGQYDQGGVGIEVDDGRGPFSFVLFVLHGVDDGKAAVDPAFLAAPQGSGRSRGVKADATADVRICGQCGEHASVFQLIPAGFGVGCSQTVVGHQLLQPVQCAAVAHKTIEHTAGCQRVHCLLSPVAADLQTAQTLRQRKTKVHVLQGDVPLVILVFGGVAALMIHIRFGQVAKLLLFRGGQPGYMAKIQGIRHGSPLIRCAFCGLGRVCRFSRPTVPGRRLPAAGCCHRQSHTRR